MSQGLTAAIAALPATAWQDAAEEADAVRHWAEVAYVPTDRRANRDSPPPPRYLVLRITKKQGVLFADGSSTRHYAVVTNLPDPADGCGLDLIRWQRGKAGTVEHAHHVLTNELAAEALPAANFAANAAWFRLNVLLYNLLSAFKRTALPEDLHNARPKRLRFVAQTPALRPARRHRQGRPPRPRDPAPLLPGTAPATRRPGSRRPRCRAARTRPLRRLTTSPRYSGPQHRRPAACPPPPA